MNLSGKVPTPKPQKRPRKPRKPIRQVSDKKRKHRASQAGRDGLEHMARVAQLPCVICWMHRMQQLSRTTVHHAICGRFSRRKAPDTSTLPLCDGHHQGDFDTSKVAIHRDRDEWVSLYGEDTEYLPVVADMLAGGVN